MFPAGPGGPSDERAVPWYGFIWNIASG